VAFIAWKAMAAITGIGVHFRFVLGCCGSGWLNATSARVHAWAHEED
jgi:hypothetical protein